jgi:hypothetical protein
VHTHIRLLASTGGCELFGAQIANDDSRAFAFLRKHLPAFDTRQSALGAAGITAGRRLADVCVRRISALVMVRLRHNGAVSLRTAGLA